jgi:trehalose/maltose transport system substrate-binding protein
LDVLEIDVTWPGLLARELVDLTPYLDGSESQFAPALIDNNRVGGRLVALPWFLDFGLLYYRKDLLEAQGIPVPEDWEQLEDAAIRLQDHQRESGEERFWGFVWQGWPDEGLTCNALEWIESWGGGSIVEPDGRISVGNPKAEHALKRPTGWLHILSPESVLSYTDRESLEQFASGEAAFLRHWPGAWSVLEAEGSQVRGKVGVAPLPKGGPEGRHVGTLGGWQLAVSRHSPHPELAADLVRFLTSAEVQRQRALAGTLVPTRPAVYKDPEVVSALPFLGLLADGGLELVARPSTVTGASYPEVSELLQQGLARLLDGRESSEEMLSALVEALERMSEGGTRW